MAERNFCVPNLLHVVHLENEELKVTILPEIGFKIASIYYKPKNFELLTQPVGLGEGKDFFQVYRRAYPGAPFSEYDLSGIDDCIPTIDECNVEGIGHFNDHGDAWSRPWNVFVEDRNTLSVKAYIRLSMMPLYFERHVHLRGREIKIDYRILNESIVERPWLWTLHGLCRYEEDAELVLPGPKKYLDAHNGEDFPFDLTKMAEVPKEEAYKFYLTEPLTDGRAAIRYPSQGMEMRLFWDKSLFPYLGGWIHTGGSQGNKTIALEPTNGFYDRLDRAIQNGKVGRLGANKELRWTIRLDLEELTP